MPYRGQTIQSRLRAVVFNRYLELATLQMTQNLHFICYVSAHQSTYIFFCTRSILPKYGTYFLYAHSLPFGLCVEITENQI